MTRYWWMAVGVGIWLLTFFIFGPSWQAATLANIAFSVWCICVSIYFLHESGKHMKEVRRHMADLKRIQRESRQSWEDINRNPNA